MLCERAMPDPRCVLCGDKDEVRWIAGLDAHLCERCRRVIYEQEKQAAGEAQK